ncbi:MAG TPA: Ig-like domain-containing protein, partial [Phycisphaerae bacterium]|nr:Ig-like domain-containing protein [Phycisphaerae bacterium]
MSLAACGGWPLFEPLEPRLLLDGAPEILGIQATHPDFRFIAGADLPQVQESFTAQVSGTTSSVRFNVGGMTFLDSNAADGWSATFNMTGATTADPLTVTATGPGGSDVDGLPVDILLMPTWFYSDDPGMDAEFGVSWDWASGYSFDVTVTHLDLGFDTPADWVFRIPGIQEPLFDLANKHTGFLAQSTFDLVSSPSGIVTSSGYELTLSAEVLDESVFEKTISFNASDSVPYEMNIGLVHIEGSVAYGAEINPHFDNSLLLDGVSGNLWMDPSLTITMPLFQARIPLLSFVGVVAPGVLDAFVEVGATVGFGTAPGHDHVIELIPTITDGGLGLQQFKAAPALTAGITGTVGVDALLGAGTVEASVTGTLAQGLVSEYVSGLGWSHSAPGELTISGAAGYSTFWGFGPSGEIDLFNWTIASWDFLSQSGSATEPTQTHNYESGALTNPWMSPYPGPHDSLTFMVDYSNPGQAPQIARLAVDSEQYYDMMLVDGTADNGVYSVTVVGVAGQLHEYGFIFVDEAGEYHIQGFGAFPDRVYVVGVDPIDGGPMVAHDANIRIDFNKPMDHTTLNASTITVVGSVSGAHDGTYPYSGTTLTVNPDVDFSPGEVVTVTVTHDAWAADGSRIGSDYVFSFAALDATPTPIVVGGTLAASTTWTSGNVYHVTQDLVIPSTRTLTIEPGVVVKFGTSQDMVVSGTLDLQGTAGSRVVFTHIYD